MSPITVRNDEIVQEVTMNAPAERIFAALTKSDEILKWWAAEGKFHVVSAECDPQPGGKWLIRVAASSEHDAPSTVYGEYRIIEAPHLLTYTWIREIGNYPDTLVRWDLKETDGYTTVRVTHSGFKSVEDRTRNNGWPVVVGLLQAYVEAKEQLNERY